MRVFAHCRTFATCIGVCSLACGVASAQYETGFEAPTFTGSPSGTILTGQDAFYLPPGTNSVDYFVYTHAGNALGLPPNPGGGGEQFVAGCGPAGEPEPFYARAQRDMTWGTGVWEVVYDVACVWQDSGGPAAQNLGSFSVQPHSVPPDPPASASYAQLFTWMDENDPPLGWRAGYLRYTRDDQERPWPGSIAGPEWENLELNHWYRFKTTLDFDLNKITEVSITDLSTGDTATFAPARWHLRGGEGATPPTPTGFRFFAGSGAEPGNCVAWDNLRIAPPQECVGDVDGDGDTDLADLAALLAAYRSVIGDPNYNPNADFDNDGDVDLGDLAFLLADYRCGT